MRTPTLLLAALLAAHSPVALGSLLPAPEEPRRETPPPKATPRPETVKKTAPKEGAATVPDKKKSDPRGMEVEPVDFKKAQEKPKPH